MHGWLGLVQAVQLLVVVGWVVKVGGVDRLASELGWLIFTFES